MTTNPAHPASRPFSPLMRQHNNRSPGLSTGSATQTLTNTPQRSQSPEPLILRLRGTQTPQSDSASDDAEGSTRRRRPHIQWAEDVIDNEGLGRKKSKVCCIYHKPRPAGESSDESSSDSSSSDSDDSDFGGGRDGARPVGGRKGVVRGRKGHGHGHGHDHEHGDGCGHGEGKNVKKARRPSPNAYEKMPKYDVKPLTRQPSAAS